jgi:lysine 2-monooxygenase
MSDRSFLTRRELIAGALATSIVPAAVRSAAAAQEALPDNVDVAIVGGGISGLYAAWRLLTAPSAERASPPPSVAVFEAAGRLGGRIFSATPPGMPHVPAELGAMRIVTSQAFVLALTRELGLPLADFPMGTDANLVYLRTKRFRLRDYARPAAVPYALRPAELGKSPDGLLFGAIEKLVPNYSKLDRAGWLAVKKNATRHGVPLWNRGFWNVLSEVLSNEALDLIREGGGYPSFLSNWNAAEASEYLTSDFPVGAAYRTIRGGMQRLPEAVAERVGRAGGMVRRRAQVAAVHVVSQNPPAFRLTFRPARAGDAPRVVNAKSVIFALPRRAIELIDTGSLLAAPDVRRAFDAIEGVVASKVFLGYHTPWWRQLGLRSGRANTDLPMAQCYYFGTEREQPGGEPGNTNSLLMASYANDGPADFWTFAEGEAAAPLESNVRAELGRQLAAVHGLTPPEPYTSLAVDWGRDPYGGAWHIWRPGERSWEVMPRIRKPVAELPLSIVGEAWSTEAGWIEGALNTAEHVLEEQYGLSRPAWLPRSYSIGS